MTHTCSSCPAWKRVAGEHGECHAGPPPHRGNTQEGSKPAAVWPPAHMNEWCMKHPGNAPLMFARKRQEPPPPPPQKHARIS